MIRATATLAGLPATPPPTVSVPNAAPETIVVSIWGGPPGPAGEPGAGVSLQGVASTWPPSDTPAVGDLYVVADPVPAGTPAGIDAGDGVVWSGTEWVSTGPIRGPAGATGPEGPDGPQGLGPSVFEGPTEPAVAVEGDLWLKPEVDPDGNPVLQLNVYTGTDWRPVAGGAGSGTVDTTGGEFAVLMDDIGDSGVSPALPLQTYASITSSTIGKMVRTGSDASLRSVVVANAMGVGVVVGDIIVDDPGNATVLVVGPSVSGSAFFASETVHAGGIRTKGIIYGIRQDPTGRAVSGGYELPLPTGDGYLRSDPDEAAGWYFAEPVVVSDTAPPAPAGGGAVWIDPTGPGVPDTSDGALSEANPLKYASPLVMEQTDGTPIGISADGLTFHQPVIHGAIPIVIDGKRYLLPVIEE